MSHHRKSKAAGIVMRSIGGSSIKPGRQNRVDSGRSLQFEQLEARRVFAGLVFSPLVSAEHVNWDVNSNGNSSAFVSFGKDFDEAKTQVLVDRQLKLATAAGSGAQGVDGSGTGVVSLGATNSLLPGMPGLNSNPASTATLYLDFDGHFESTWGSYSNVVTPAFDLDGNSGSFNSEESAYIQNVWAIVAEDYAPFNINVTTVEPAVLAPGVPSGDANGVALRIAIGGDGSQINNSMAGYLGYAYLNSFTNSTSNVAYVFPFSNSSTSSIRSIFSVSTGVSHEAGHSFGLRHHTGAGSYDIANRSQHIMLGATLGYEDNFWGTSINDLGSYQDDMAILSNSTNGFGYRVDDHGNTVSTASMLTANGSAFDGSGIISTSSDVDVWKMTSSSPQSLQVSVQGAAIGQNLDAVLELLDANGNVVLTSDPTDSNDAQLIFEGTGTQTIRVRSTGEYGRTGQYTISTAPSTPGISVVAQPTLLTSETGVADAFRVALTSKPTSDVVTDLVSSNPFEATLSTSQLVFTPTNWYLPQTVAVQGMDDSFRDGPQSYNITLTVTSNDTNYAGLAVAALPAINADDDTPGWVAALQGNSSTAYAYTNDITVLPDGSLMTTGSFAGTVDFDPGVGVSQFTASGTSYDSFVAKYSASGELIWVTPYGGQTTTIALVVDNAGSTYITGYTSSASLTLGTTTLTGNGSNDSFLAKLDSNGNFVWAKNWGSTGTDGSHDIALDNNGNLVVIGFFEGTVDFKPGAGVVSRTSKGEIDGFAARYDSAGNFLSVTTFGGTSTDYPSKLTVDGNGNLYISGNFYGTTQLGSQTLTSLGTADGFLVRMNPAGGIDWARQAFTEAGSGSKNRLARSTDGTIYWAANFSDAVNFGPDTPTITNVGGGGIYLARFNDSGNFLGVGQLDSSEGIYLGDIAVDAQGRLAIYGRMSGTADLDPSTAVAYVAPVASNAEFLVRLDSNGQLVETHGMPTPDRISAPHDVAFDPQGNLFISGEFYEKVVTPTGRVLNKSVGASATYLMKLNLVPGVNVLAASPLQVSENGDQASVGIALATKPTANVVMTLSSSDLTEGTVSPTTLTFTPSNWKTPQTVTVTGVHDTLIDGDQLFQIQLVLSSADVNYNGLAVSSIPVLNLDSSVTKFYVVNDAATDRTYEYDPSGAAIENYAINSGNSAPRGAASTATGTTVWVADKNRKVYVYDTQGGLKGSWSAGTLSSKAQVEGLATNGTDVWIVDNQSDKVYRYSNAATRLSGSQNAVSSFSLNTGNTNPKGIVTDGAYLWVVNDASSDKVFKYTLSGSLVGSWTIDTGNKTPTGLTIDPVNGSQSIWIVDSGTDRVYEYFNSRDKTSGSQAANLTFNLASGNSNPQGIADPPTSPITTSAKSVTGAVLVPSTPSQLSQFTLSTNGSSMRRSVPSSTNSSARESIPIRPLNSNPSPVRDLRSSTEFNARRSSISSPHATDQFFALDYEPWEVLGIDLLELASSPKSVGKI